MLSLKTAREIVQYRDRTLISSSDN